MDASALGLAPNCRGYVTAQPDVIVRYTNPVGWLRFYVSAPGGYRAGELVRGTLFVTELSSNRP